MLESEWTAVVAGASGGIKGSGRDRTIKKIWKDERTERMIWKSRVKLMERKVDYIKEKKLKDTL